MIKHEIVFDLNRHHARREQGVPTVTVLAGPIGLGMNVWNRWCREKNIQSFRVDADSDVMVRAWIQGLACRRKPELAACDWLAARCGTGPQTMADRLAGMTLHDFDLFVRSIGLEADDRSTGALCYSFMQARIRGEPSRGTIVRYEDDPLSLKWIEAYSGLYAIAEWPTLLLAPTDDKDLRIWLEKAIRLAAVWSGHIPQLAIAVAAPESAVRQVLEEGRIDQATTMLREGLVEVQGLNRSDLEARLNTAGIKPESWKSTVEILTRIGVGQEVADSFVATVQEIERQTSLNTPEQESKARSAAEQFLFDQLESLPQTVGLFRLNERLEFRHGPAFAEADLSSAEIKLVIEVDGSYYHLKDRESYRRDRRKDWLFQRHGYLALRFLADDVVQYLEEILNTILEAVALRRASLTPTPDDRL